MESVEQTVFFVRLVSDGDDWRVAMPVIGADLVVGDDRQFVVTTWLVQHHRAFGAQPGDVLVGDWYGDHPVAFLVNESGVQSQRDWSADMLERVAGRDLVP